MLPYIVVAAGATNIGLNFLLIPPFGMMGAAFSTLLGYVVAVAITYAFSQHYYRIQYQARRIGKVLAILVAGTLCAVAEGNVVNLNRLCQCTILHKGNLMLE